MTPSTRTAAPALRRVGFTFSADGSHAACVAAADGGRWYAESWRLDAPGGAALPTALPLPGGRPENPHTQVVSLADGRVLVCRRDGDLNRLAVLAPAVSHAEEHFVGTLRAPALRLLPLPVPATVRPGAPVAVALATDARPATSVWLLGPGDGAAPQCAAEVPGLFGGGTWLDHEGRLLALDRVADGTVRSVVLDLTSGAVTPLLELAEQPTNDRLVLFDPGTRLALVRSDAPGEDRLGWGLLGGPDPLRFPEALHRPGTLLRPVAVEPGRAEPRVAVQLDRGAGSALALWSPATGRLDPLPVPAGRLGGVAHWSAAGLRMPYSAPDRPAAMATLDVAALLRPPAPRRPPDAAVPVTTGWRLDGSAAAPGDGGRWQPAGSAAVPAAEGRMEAVVYGGAGWAAARHLVVALHGGPTDAWRLEFEPTLQRLAADGVAVAAPNQRGSSGYGPEYALCLRGAWGGPDLEDVLCLLSELATRRAALGLEPPALFGISYGAFLALLAACHAPAGQVARCAVVAPFLSGARLLAEAAAPVRALTTRLGGGVPIDDERGPRDVLRLCHRIEIPLLMVHGDRDEVVPVSQSRALRQQLLRVGRTEGADFRYVEVAGAGHELLAEEGAPALRELLAAFLHAGRAPFRDGIADGSGPSVHRS
ncbi:alpha/beta fold hydrolase [Peterkaempfera sp. SMS 1(5)a]|uniref:alpha/beta fold hydrolase n=1 Tax=Peterkaempfera podocarpi TaxID=3232308 RepID=UPI00366CD3FA